MDILTSGLINPTTPPSARQTGGGFVWQGAWSSAANYQPYDTVSYNSAVYVALVANNNITPADGATWSLFIANLDYQIASYFPGTYGSNGELTIYAAVREFTLPVNCAGSIATLAAASTGTAVFKIKKNGSQVGTITFTSSANGVFSMSSSETFNVDDVLSVFSPMTVDATAASFSVSFLGQRVF